MASQTLLSTLTSKGQLTLPVSIRRQLGLQAQDQVVFIIDDTGRIELQKPKYTTVDSITGIVPALSQPLDTRTMRQIAHDDRFALSTEGNDPGSR